MSTSGLPTYMWLILLSLLDRCGAGLRVGSLGKQSDCCRPTLKSAGFCYSCCCCLLLRTASHYLAHAGQALIGILLPQRLKWQNYSSMLHPALGLKILILLPGMLPLRVTEKCPPPSPEVFISKRHHNLSPFLAVSGTVW